MKHGSLFSGIGGFDLAAQWMGWENVFHCEINEFCNKILKHYWPYAKSYTDIKETDFTGWKGKVDIISGGFPCQPYSNAGKRKGKDDDRHLWPEMLRAIREIQPRWIVGENVPGLLNWKRGMVLAEIKADLEDSGFEVLPPLILPACGKNAPHRRDRLWIIAHSNKKRLQYGNGTECGELQDFEKRVQDDRKACRSIKEQFTSDSRLFGQTINEVKTAGIEQCDKKIITNTKQFGQPGSRRTEGQISTKENGNWKASWIDSNGEWPTEQPVRSGDDGLSSKLVRDSLSAAGNAVVPQIVFELFKAISILST